MLDFLLPAFAPHLKTAVPRLRPRCKKPRLLGPQHPPQRRAQSSLPERASQKPYYVTTPIFYVNADPHLGHYHSMLVADVLKRWQELQGRTAILCTGTDEHGQKVQRAAAAAKQEPLAFCDERAAAFRELAAYGGISNTHFVRTTEERHRQAVEHFWYLLQERGMIYLDKHEGWYSVSDECFFPESAVEYTLDRRTGRKMHASIETGSEVEWTEEENYKFRLSSMKDRLLEFYKAHPDFIVPNVRYQDIIRTVEEGLKDLSISRPASRLDWALKVPNDPSQTIYVWLDALVNYITEAGFPWAPGQESALGWPADVHVIGKDIMRFHCIHWPAFLMALNLPLPKQILSHPHWTLGQKKLSKSTGIIVNPFWAIDRFEVDPLRFFLMLEGGFIDDSAYDNALVARTYKWRLQNGIGNLLRRVVASKKMWKVSEVVKVAEQRKDFDWAGADIGRWYKTIDGLRDRMDVQMKALDIRAAVQQAVAGANAGDQLLQHNAPWLMFKSEDAAIRERGIMVVFLTAELLRIVGILLQPVMPGKMTRLLDQLGVDPERRRFQDAVIGVDYTYGTPMEDLQLSKGADSGLFPPITID